MNVWQMSTISDRVVKRALTLYLKRHLSKEVSEMREQAQQISGKTQLQAEATATERSMAGTLLYIPGTPRSQVPGAETVKEMRAVDTQQGWILQAFELRWERRHWTSTAK